MMCRKLVRTGNMVRSTSVCLQMLDRRVRRVKMTNGSRSRFGRVSAVHRCVGAVVAQCFYNPICGGMGLVPDWFVPYLLQTMWHRDRFFSEYFGYISNNVCLFEAYST